MKRFKTKKVKKYNDLYILVFLIIFLLIFHYYNKYISPRFKEIASSIVEKNSIEYIKKSIILDNYDINKLVYIDKNKNDEILYIDIDYNEANSQLRNIIKKIGESKFENINELKTNKGNYYIELPLNFLLSTSGVGPIIPIKIVFFDNILCSINTSVLDYGINNALISIYLNVKVREKIILPYKTETIDNDYKILLYSKIINGKVPSFYNGNLNKSSNIISENFGF